MFMKAPVTFSSDYLENSPFQVNHVEFAHFIFAKGTDIEIGFRPLRGGVIVKGRRFLKPAGLDGPDTVERGIRLPSIDVAAGNGAAVVVAVFGHG